MAMNELAAALQGGVFRNEITLFFSTFTTLLAVINPLEALPVFLMLVSSKSEGEQRRVARAASLYAFLLVAFFLFFGAFILKIFGVPLSMVRIAGGIVLTRIGFELFTPSGAGKGSFASAGPDDNIAFMPLAMPLMVGPGAIATILGMMATIERSRSESLAFGAIFAAILAAIFVVYLCLAYAGGLVARLGPMGINAASRIVGFFISAMGVSLVFNGVIEALQTQGVRVVL